MKSTRPGSKPASHTLPSTSVVLPLDACAPGMKRIMLLLFAERATFAPSRGLPSGSVTVTTAAIPGSKTSVPTSCAPAPASHETFLGRASIGCTFAALTFIGSGFERKLPSSSIVIVGGFIAAIQFCPALISSSDAVPAGRGVPSADCATPVIHCAVSSFSSCTFSEVRRRPIQSNIGWYLSWETLSCATSPGRPSIENVPSALEVAVPGETYAWKRRSGSMSRGTPMTKIRASDTPFPSESTTRPLKRSPRSTTIFTSEGTSGSSWNGSAYAGA